MILTKGAEKRLRALAQKKQRQLQRRFVVEGKKLIEELIAQFPERIIELYLTESFEAEMYRKKLSVPNFAVCVSEVELGRIAQLKTPNGGVAVVEIPEEQPPFKTDRPLILYLDGLQDPGNMGTMLRLADWFGLEQLFCSPDCVEAYNPKVIQASMGAIFRVPLHPIELDTIKSFFPKIRLVGADLKGTPYQKISVEGQIGLVVGNEGNGIRSKYAQLLDETTTIPRLGTSGAESLNAAVASGILVSWLAVKMGG